jgi:hypothetical protein
VFVGDTCYRPPISIKPHDLHTCNIIRAVGEITSYHERDQLFQIICLLAFFWPSLFVSPMMVSTINLLFIFSFHYLILLETSDFKFLKF